MADENVVPISSADKTARKPKPPAPQRPLYPSPDAPLDVARELYKKFRTPTGRTLVSHRGDWLRWDGQQWSDWDTAHLRSTVYQRLGEVDYKRPIRKGGEIVDHELTPWNPNRNKVGNVIEALAAVAHLDAAVDAPAWIADHNADSPADQMIACTNGLLSLADRTLTPHTPAFYNHVSVPFAYQVDAPKPVGWLEFLKSVWPDDPASIKLLQEWIGYIVTGRTDMQKILLLIGPTRSGKGTVARMLRNLIGRGHVTGPTLASLGTNFGLAPLIGKPLAVIADARLGGSTVHTIVERLLSISGEDVLTLDRKFRDPWSGKLGTRLMILSNEIPRFSDSSGAVANRLLVLQMRNSFLGKEDRTLDARIGEELPGILNWALEGLDRLSSKGRFTVPKASGEATTMLMDLASPVSAFVRDCCTRSDDVRVERDRLYNAWKVWCFGNGHEAGSKATFGRNLAAAVPDLGTTQPRVGGRQIRYYTRIGMLPVSPVSSPETAGQAHQSGVGDPASGPASPIQPTLLDTRADTPGDVAKPQVKAPDTGDTGESALSPEPQKQVSCTQWLDEYISDLRDAGVQYHAAGAAYAAGSAHYGKSSIANAVKNHPDIRTADKTGRGTVWWCIDPSEELTYMPVSEFVANYLDALPTDTVEVDQDHFYAAAEAADIDRHTARKVLVRDSGRIDSQPAHGRSKSDRVWLIRREAAS